MNRMTIRVSTLLLSTLAGWCGVLRIDPPADGRIRVTYQAASAGPFELVYGFTEFRTLRAETETKAGEYVAEVAVPADAVYFWCQVRDKSSGEIDTNRGLPWDRYLVDAGGRPLEGARRVQSSVFAMGRQKLDAVVVRRLLIEEELRAFPQSAQAYGEWWSLRLSERGGTNAARTALLVEVDAFYQAHADEAWAYLAATLGYNRLNQNARALEVLREFARRFPEDIRCDRVMLTLLFNYGTVADLESLATRSQRWQGNRDYWNCLLHRYAWSKAARERLLDAGRRVLALTPAAEDDHGEARSEVAEIWLEGGVDPREAERAARDCVAIAETGRKLENPNAIVAIHRSTLGWALFLEGRYVEAREELDRAVRIREQQQLNARAVYYRLGRTLQRLGRSSEALDAFARELAWGDLERPTREACAGFGDELSRRANALLASATTDSVTEMNVRPGRFALRGPGGTVSLSAYEGKLVIVEFWASWCGPCLRSMEHSSRLMAKYPGRLAVLAVAVDDEDTRPRARRLLAEKGYPFTLLYDDASRRDLEMPSVPARFLIDASGKVRLRETGWSQAQEIEFERKLAAIAASTAAPSR